MISQELRDAIRPTSLLLSVVWAGEFFCYGVYYFIVHQAASRGDVAQGADDWMLPMLFGLIGGVALLGGIGLKWFLFSQRRARAFLSQPPPPSSDAGQDMTPDEQSLVVLAKRMFQPYVVSLGMINSCVLFGMVLALMQRDIGVFTPYLDRSGGWFSPLLPEAGGFHRREYHALKLHFEHQQRIRQKRK